MKTTGTDIEAINARFYEEVYSAGHFPALAVKYVLSYDQLSKTRRNLKFLKRMLESPGTLSILDYGFGHGTLLLRLPRVHRISGCELSTRAVKNLRFLCQLLRREVTLYSPEELATAHQSLSVDVVCCSHVIEHVEDDAALLRVFYKILGPNGYLMLNVPINEVWNDPKHVRAYSAGSIRATLGSAGFTVQEVLEADRWTGWILHHERVSPGRFGLLFRAIRLLLALLPLAAWEAFERFVPDKYKYQQLLVLAKKT